MLTFIMTPTTDKEQCSRKKFFCRKASRLRVLVQFDIRNNFHNCYVIVERLYIKSFRMMNLLGLCYLPRLMSHFRIDTQVMNSKPDNYIITRIVWIDQVVKTVHCRKHFKKRENIISMRKLIMQNLPNFLLRIVPPHRNSCNEIKGFEALANQNAIRQSQSQSDSQSSCCPCLLKM